MAKKPSSPLLAALCLRRPLARHTRCVCLSVCPVLCRLLTVPMCRLTGRRPTPPAASSRLASELINIGSGALHRLVVQRLSLISETNFRAGSIPKRPPQNFDCGGDCPAKSAPMIYPIFVQCYVMGRFGHENGPFWMLAGAVLVFVFSSIRAVLVCVGRFRPSLGPFWSVPRSYVRGTPNPNHIWLCENSPIENPM